MEGFENLKRVALNEVKKLNSQYANKEEFSEADSKKYECLMHGLKCQLSVEMALEATYGYSETGNMSERRAGRGMNGQYVSRGNYDGPYGYYGYSEHYPPMMPEPRRWW